jgi:hypothetical protein
VLNTNEAHDHVDRKIKKVVTHRDFDKFTYEYDIALLEMHDGPINYQPNIIPICLPVTDNGLVGEVSRASSDLQLTCRAGWDGDGVGPPLRVRPDLPGPQGGPAAHHLQQQVHAAV